MKDSSRVYAGQRSNRGCPFRPLQRASVPDTAQIDTLAVPDTSSFEAKLDSALMAPQTILDYVPSLKSLKLNELFLYPSQNRPRSLPWILNAESGVVEVESQVEQLHCLRSRNQSKLWGADLQKIYRNRCVVEDVDIEVVRGEIVGLLGPNGAGKTTTFFMMVGLIPPAKVPSI